MSFQTYNTCLRRWHGIGEYNLTYNTDYCVHITGIHSKPDKLLSYCLYFCAIASTSDIWIALRTNCTNLYAVFGLESIYPDVRGEPPILTNGWRGHPDLPTSRVREAAKTVQGVSSVEKVKVRTLNFTRALLQFYLKKFSKRSVEKCQLSWYIFLPRRFYNWNCQRCSVLFSWVLKAYVCDLRLKTSCRNVRLNTTYWPVSNCVIWPLVIECCDIWYCCVSVSFSYGRNWETLMLMILEEKIDVSRFSENGWSGSKVIECEKYVYMFCV